MVFRPIEEVCHVEDYHGEVVRRVHARVYVPQKPLVVMQEALFHACARPRSIPVPVVPRSEKICMRGVDIIALVELPLQPRQSNQDCQVLPHIAATQLHSVSYCIARP